jgi:hypothetical protein
VAEYPAVTVPTALYEPAHYSLHQKAGASLPRGGHLTFWCAAVPYSFSISADYL